MRIGTALLNCPIKSCILNLAWIPNSVSICYLNFQADFQIKVFIKEFIKNVVIGFFFHFKFFEFFDVKVSLVKLFQNRVRVRGNFFCKTLYLFMVKRKCVCEGTLSSSSS